MKAQIFLICLVFFSSGSAQLVRFRNRVVQGVQRVCNEGILLDDGTFQPPFCQDVLTTGVRPVFGTTRIIGSGGGRVSGNFGIGGGGRGAGIFGGGGGGRGAGIFGGGGGGGGRGNNGGGRGNANFGNGNGNGGRRKRPNRIGNL